MELILIGGTLVKAGTIEILRLRLRMTNAIMSC
jgi:hypothetical protein